VTIGYITLPAQSNRERSLLRSQAYRRDGFLSPVPAITPHEAARARAELEHFERATGQDAGQAIRGKGHLKLRAVHDLVRHPAILDRVEQILGPEILCWGVSLFSKPAGDEAFVGLHADSFFWGLSSYAVCSAWVALTESTVENGAMRCLRGSHLAPAPHPHAVVPGTANMLHSKEEVAPDAAAALRAEGGEVACTLAAGEMTLFHVRPTLASVPPPPAALPCPPCSGSCTPRPRVGIRSAHPCR
jgi:ectoine hydroxylase-related dioxygenase (phytanoyl-CoA dioxygenase family)